MFPRPPAGGRAYGGAGTMSVPVWSRFTDGGRPTKPGRPRGPRREPASRPPGLEVLEDRLLPSGGPLAGLGPPLAAETGAEQPPAARSAPDSPPPLIAVTGTGD